MKPGESATVVVVALVLLLVLYVGGYVVLYDPEGPLMIQVDGICQVEHYRYGGRAAEFVFAPLQFLDWRK